MRGCGGLTDSCSKCVMCLSGGVCFIKNSAHDKTYVLGGGRDTSCVSYNV